jgi:hypothetical protein
VIDLILGALGKDMTKYITHITVHPGEDCLFTVNFYKDDEYTGDACGAATLDEAMYISDMWASTGGVDWKQFYVWLNNNQEV